LAYLMDVFVLVRVEFFLKRTEIFMCFNIFILFYVSEDRMDTPTTRQTLMCPTPHPATPAPLQIPATTTTICTPQRRGTSAGAQIIITSEAVVLVAHTAAFQMDQDQRGRAPMRGPAIHG
jgi:hypothetical protein